jgi:hypothetical protein
MYSNIDAEPSNHEKETSEKVWPNAMMKEYNSIMNNDVWEIVP